MENDLYLDLHKEPLTYHRGGQWFKSSTAHCILPLVSSGKLRR
jgi:hypothetical protein